MINYSDFNLISISEDSKKPLKKFKIQSIQEIDKDSTGQSGCMIICEDANIGQLRFYKIVNLDKNGDN